MVVYMTRLYMFAALADLAVAFCLFWFVFDQIIQYYKSVTENITEFNTLKVNESLYNILWLANFTILHIVGGGNEL